MCWWCLEIKLKLFSGGDLFSNAGLIALHAPGSYSSLFTNSIIVSILN